MNWTAAISALSLLLSATARVEGESPIQNSQCSGVIQGIVYQPSGQPLVDAIVVADPVGVDLGVLLPDTRTDQNGEYRFEHLCNGRYAVILDDPRTGYPTTSPYQNEFLSGMPMITVRLNWFHKRAELPVHLPPKPGRVLLHVHDAKTQSELERFNAILRVPGRPHFREESFSFDESPGDREFSVPPGQDVILLVKVEGYKDVSNRVHVDSGSRAIVDLDVEATK